MTNEELKNASEEYCPDDAYPFGPDIINKEVRKAFIAGWKAKEESEKPVPNDLEEAAMNYIAPIENEDGLKVINFSGQDIKDAFIAGSKWQKEQDNKELSEKIATAYQLGIAHQKEQMLKEAVEGEVVKDISNKLAVTAKINLDGFKFGDKVRIIVLKNTEK